jgi:hypothetical protein
MERGMTPSTPKKTAVTVGGWWIEEINVENKIEIKIEIKIK